MMLLVLVVIGTIFFYFFIIKPGNYWKERHVPTGKIIPIFGEHYLNILGKDCSTEFAQRIYNNVPDARYLGIYLFQTPVLVLRSPDLIKDICVKNFNNVLDRRNIPPDCDELLVSKNLMGLKGQQWKEFRHLLSPSFSSSKMKAIYVLLCDNASKIVQYLMDKHENLIEEEVKDTFTRYTNDAIANTIYGLEINSFTERKNEFFMMGKKVTDFSAPWKIFVVLLYTLAPKIAKKFKVALYGKKTADFYTDLCKRIIELREEKNIERPDVLGLLIEARKKFEKSKTCNEESEGVTYSTCETPNEKVLGKYLSNEEIAAHLFLFKLGGYDTSSSAMCYMAYELATHPEIQKKLIAEIDQIKSEIATPTYEAIMNMTYLDMVVSETLRKWPSLALTDRLVTAPFTIAAEQPGEKPLQMKKKDLIIIPIFGIHRDPKYYENPDRFDPERFSPENRKNITPYTYMPFGVGPRNCIGMRLALLEIKVLFFYLLSNFEIVATEKTKLPLRLKRTMVTSTADDDFPLAFKKRSSKI